MYSLEKYSQSDSVKKTVKSQTNSTSLGYFTIPTKVNPLLSDERGVIDTVNAAISLIQHCTGKQSNHQFSETQTHG